MAELATRSGISTLETLAGGSLAKKTAIVVLGSIFMAAMTQISVPFFPVPMTLQTLAVMLIGMSELNGNAEFTDINIGQDASTLGQGGPE